VGAGFVAVHEMLDDHVNEVRDMVDEVAERIATLGGEPNGLPGALVESRSWDDNPLARRWSPPIWALWTRSMTA
jgi:starvation-inducible DNA-binding protein